MKPVVLHSHLDSGINWTRHDLSPQRPWLSVIIPARNEGEQIVVAIESALAAMHVEVIVVDGGSDDDTMLIARSCGAKALCCLPPSRGDQMNLGAAHARGEALLFLHADTRLPSDYVGHIRRALAEDGVVAGAFRLAFDDPRPLLRLVAGGANLRSRWRQLPYGDQALFMASNLFHKSVDSLGSPSWRTTRWCVSGDASGVSASLMPRLSPPLSGAASPAFGGR